MLGKRGIGFGLYFTACAARHIVNNYRGRNAVCKVGVVSVVFISYDVDISKQKLQEYIKNDTESIYMLYCVPLDTDLATLEHYPSIAVTKKDLM